MTIDDPIYGTLYIEEPVIQEVILSKPVQRLQGLMQCGITYFRFPDLDTTRFDHSVGVMALLQSWDAPVEEQLAGLLHDVNHLAFSHVADIAFGDAGGQEFAEQFQRQIIMESEIPEILKFYGIDPELMIDFKQFPLLEQNLPDLCADRFDYGLRDAVKAGDMSLEQAHEILDDVHIIGGQQIAFKTVATARLFGDQFRQLNVNRYVHPLDMTLYKMFADALNAALTNKVITMKDLFLTDEEVWEKMAACTVAGVTEVIKKIPQLKVKVVDEGQAYDYQVKSKIRLIDPLVVIGSVDSNEVERLSVLDPDFAMANTEYLNSVQDGFLVKVV